MGWRSCTCRRGTWSATASSRTSWKPIAATTRPGPSERLRRQRAGRPAGRRRGLSQARPPGPGGRGGRGVRGVDPARRHHRDDPAQPPLHGRGPAHRRARVPDRRTVAGLRPARRPARAARFRRRPLRRRRRRRAGRGRGRGRRPLAARRRGAVPRLRGRPGQAGRSEPDRRAGAADRPRPAAPVRLRPRRARGRAGDALAHRGAAVALARRGTTVNGLRVGDIWTLVAVALLTVVAAFLAMSETAITRTNRIRALHLQEEGRRGARQLLALVEQTARSLNGVLLLVLVVQFTATSLFTSVMERVVGGGLGVALAAVIMTLVTFIFAEVAPKTYAVQQTDRAALTVAPVVYWITRLPVLGPLTRLLIAIGNVITPGKGLKTGPFVSEDELRALVDEAKREEVIEEEEREMIHSVFEFGDTIVREVMVPRPDMVVVPVSHSLQQVLELILRSGFSRIPVYGRDIDDISGLVTIEDLLEEIVGEIADEYDREEPNVEPLPDGDFRVNARLSINEVNELLDVELPATEWDSIGGLLFNLIGDVPKEGQEIEFQGLALRAERVQGRRVGRVRIHRLTTRAAGLGNTAEARKQ